MASCWKFLNPSTLSEAYALQLGTRQCRFWLIWTWDRPHWDLNSSFSSLIYNKDLIINWYIKLYMLYNIFINISPNGILWHLHLQKNQVKIRTGLIILDAKWFHWRLSGCHGIDLCPEGRRQILRCHLWPISCLHLGALSRSHLPSFQIQRQ